MGSSPMTRDTSRGWRSRSTVHRSTRSGRRSSPPPSHASAALPRRGRDTWIDRSRSSAGDASSPDGLEEELVLRWWAESPCQVPVLLEVAADFADIFAIRGLSSAPLPPPASVHTSRRPSDGIRFWDEETGLSTLVRLAPAPDSLDGGVASWSPRLRRGKPWRVRVTVQAGERRRAAGGRPDRAGSAVRSRGPERAPRPGQGLPPRAGRPGCAEHAGPSRRWSAPGGRRHPVVRRALRARQHHRGAPGSRLSARPDDRTPSRGSPLVRAA